MIYLEKNADMFNFHFLADMNQVLTLSNGFQVNVPMSIFNADRWNKLCLHSITTCFQLQWPNIQMSVRSMRATQTWTGETDLPELLFLPYSFGFWLHMSAQALLGTNNNNIDIITLHLLWLVCDIVGGLCVHTHGCVAEDIEDAGLWLLTDMPHLSHKPDFIHDV